DGRDHAACAVPRFGAGADRPHERAGPGHVRQPALIDRAHQGWQDSCACGHARDALAGSAGYPDDRGVGAGLRGGRLVWHWRAGPHPERHRRSAQPRGPRRPRRSEDQGTARELGQSCSDDVTRTSRTSLRPDDTGAIRRARAATGWSYWFTWVVTGMAELTAIGVYVGYWLPALPPWLTPFA